MESNKRASIILRKSLIHGVVDDGEWVEGTENIGRSAANHFADQLGTRSVVNLENLKNLIPLAITEEDSAILVAIPTEQEVSNAVFSLDLGSVTGPDRFNGRFFQKFWSVLKTDLTSGVADFFNGATLPIGAESIVISLFSKTERPNSWTEYQLISLCTCFNKIISKILNSRLVEVLPKIISAKQAGFVRGRSIQDNTLRKN